jgi:hypothetical protein
MKVINHHYLHQEVKYQLVRMESKKEQMFKKDKERN